MVNDIGPNDSLAELLQAFTGTVESLRGQLGEVAQDLTDCSTTLQEKSDGAHADLELLSQETDEWSGVLDGASDALQDQLDGFDEHLAHVDGTFERLSHEFVEAQTHFVEQLEANRELAESGTRAVMGGVRELEDASAECHRRVDTVLEMKQRSWQHLEESLSAARHAQRSARGEAEAVLNGYAEEIGVVLTDTVTQLFTSLYEGLDEALNIGVLEGFGSFEGALTRLFEGFLQDSLEFADSLTTAVGEIMLNTAHSLVDETYHALEASFEDLLLGLVSRLVQEVAASLAVMGIGAGISAVLGALLPIIAAAKSVIAALNDLIDVVA